MRINPALSNAAPLTSDEEAHAAESRAFYHLAILESLQLLLESGQAPGWRRVRSSKSALVAQTTLPPHAFAKIFFARRWYEGIKTLFRGDRAYRSDHRTQALRAAGFSAPAVVLRGSVRGLPFLITAAAPGESLAVYLDRALHADGHATEALRLRREVVRALGREIGRLHQAGFFHTELRTSNLQVDMQLAAGYRFWFLDNEGTRRFKKLPWRRRVKNLAQLNMDHAHLGRTDRMRFLVAYLEATGLRTHRQGLVRQIILRTRRRLQENALSSAGAWPKRVAPAAVPCPQAEHRSTEALQPIQSVQRR